MCSYNYSLTLIKSLSPLLSRSKHLRITSPKLKMTSRTMQTIQVTTYTQCHLVDANMITDLSLSMKVRKIITNLKYNQENARHLKKQMKAYEMETKALPQLGMLSS